MDAAKNIEPWEELYRYWLSKHVGGRPPTRAGIDPMIDLAHLAAHLILIDLRPDGFKYRLIGSEVVGRAGFDATGKELGGSATDPRLVAAWKQGVATVAETGQGRVMLARHSGKTIVRHLIIILPLLPDADGVPKIFGGSFYDLPAIDAIGLKDLPVSEIVLDP